MGLVGNTKTEKILSISLIIKTILVSLQNGIFSNFPWERRVRWLGWDFKKAGC